MLTVRVFDCNITYICSLLGSFIAGGLTRKLSNDLWV